MLKQDAWKKPIGMVLLSWILGASGVARAEGPLDSWTLVHSIPPPFIGAQGEVGGQIKASINDIAYGAGVFVVVGQNGRIWRTSDPDDGPWVEQKSPVTKELLGVVYGAGKFVAVGLSGAIITSPDGVQWTLRPSGTASTLNAVALGMGNFIIVGDAGMVLMSSDGEIWDSLQIPGVGFLRGVAYANGTYLAVGKETTFVGVIFSSTNGRDWTAVYQAPEKVLNNLAYGFGRFVVVGSEGIVVTSEDAKNWISQILPNPHPPTTSQGRPNDLTGIAFGANGFVTTVWHWMFRSKDGLDWTLVEHELPDPVPFEIHGKESGAVFKIRYLKGRFFAVGRLGIRVVSSLVEWQPLIVVSADGIRWELIGVQINLRSIAYGKGKFVAVGEQGKIFTSLHGTQWVRVNHETNLDLNHVKFANGQFVAVGAREVIITSPDGEHWSERYRSPLGSKQQLFQSAYGDGQWISVGGVQLEFQAELNVMFRSSDGTNWFQITPGPFARGVFRTVAHGAGRFVMLAFYNERGRMIKWLSEDGIKWTEGDLISRVPADLEFGSDQFAAVMNANEIWTTSADRLSLPEGSVWTQRFILPREKLGGIQAAMSFDAGFFLASGAGAVWSSTNAIDWIEHSVSVSKEPLRDAVYGAGVYVAVGHNGTIVHSGPVAPYLVDPKLSGDTFSITVRMPAGAGGIVEVADTLNQANWTALTTVNGGASGKSQVVTDSAPQPGQKYYRLRTL